MQGMYSAIKNRLRKESPMKISIKTQLFVITGVIALMGLIVPIPVQGQTAADMEILREKIKADKKLLVAVNMELTQTEAKGFWPIYEDYQTVLQKINRRIRGLLKSYAAHYRNKSLTDERARKLIEEFLSIEQAEAKLKGSFVPKLNMVLPAKKVARYLQIENKIRAIIKYDLAAEVPLVK